MGGISGTMEQSFTFVELLREQLQKDGLDFTPENIKALLQDDKVITHKDPRFTEVDIKDTKANIIRRRSRRRRTGRRKIYKSIGTCGSSTGHNELFSANQATRNGCRTKRFRQAIRTGHNK